MEPEEGGVGIREFDTTGIFNLEWIFLAASSQKKTSRSRRRNRVELRATGVSQAMRYSGTVQS